MMNMYQLQLILLVSSLSIIVGNAQQHPSLTQFQSHTYVTTCITPNNDQGICVEIQNCPVFVSALSSGNRQCHEFIRESRCGPQRRNPSLTKVCCGTYHDYLDRLPSTACTTPNGLDGQCMELRKCSVFLNGFAVGKNDNYDFIRASQCGFQNEDPRSPKVCCGPHDDYLYKETNIPPSCTTPNNDEGVCVEIEKCSIFMDGLKLGKNDNYNFIRESRCEFQDEDQRRPKVCCGSYADYLYKIMTKAKDEQANTKKSPFSQFCGNESYATRTVLETRIYGGETASIGEFPWMARLRHIHNDNGDQMYGCSGFLISEEFVLTAAHCIYSEKMLQFGPVHQVVLGEHHTETDPDCEEAYNGVYCADPPQYIRTGDPIVHPQYSGAPHYHNDIALIPLKDRVRLSAYVYPICLAETHSQERILWVTGWGSTQNGRNSEVKLKVGIPRVDTSHCVSQYKRIKVDVADKQICAGGEYGRDSCEGDSGGPLMVKSGYKPWQAEGVVSYGKYCGRQGWPGIYTSIPKYMPWIKDIVNQYLLAHKQSSYK